jgi:hydrogenase large subunit
MKTVEYHKREGEPKMGTLILDPITRLEGHLKVEVTLDASNYVIDAKSSGGMFRDFENLLMNRVPKDAAFLTQRVCGVCPVSHAIASVKAIERTLNFTPTLQAVMLRNLIQGSNFIASHILHFYHLALMDYVQGPQMSPWSPGYNVDLRFTDSENQALIDNYLAALAIRRKAQEMGAIFGGKLPHAASIVPGGVTVIPSAADIDKFRSYLNEVQSFIINNYQADVNKIAEKYNDYLQIGKGYANLISYGVFDTHTSGTKLLPAGTVMNGGGVSPFSATNIKEYTGYSWYSSPSGQAPAAGTTTVDYGKEPGYSYIKAPRYNDRPYEAGPLARLWVSGDYRNGVSVIDRHRARALETAKIAGQMQNWLSQITPGTPGYTHVNTPVSGSGAGLTEAPRGALGHWISVSSSKIANYQIITPTCWNASPKDDFNNPGPIEKAIIGTHVANTDQPVELLRIVHAFDPCTACSVHVISPSGEELSRFVELCSVI